MYWLASGCIHCWEHVSVILVGFQNVTFFLIVIFYFFGKTLTIGSDFWKWDILESVAKILIHVLSLISYAYTFLSHLWEWYKVQCIIDGEISRSEVGRIWFWDGFHKKEENDWHLIYLYDGLIIPASEERCGIGCRGCQFLLFLSYLFPGGCTKKGLRHDARSRSIRRTSSTGLEVGWIMNLDSLKVLWTERV